MSHTFLVLRTQQAFVFLLKCKPSAGSVLISRCFLRKVVIVREETSGIGMCSNIESAFCLAGQSDLSYVVIYNFWWSKRSLFSLYRQWH